MTPLDDKKPLGEERERMREQAIATPNTEPPVLCIGCFRPYRAYHYQLNRGMSKTLINVLHAGGLEIPVKLSTLPKERVGDDAITGGSREQGRLQIWGLLIPVSGGRGLWMATQLGYDFAHCKVKLHKYYDKVLGCQPYFSEPYINIIDAYGNEFDYEEHMRGRVSPEVLRQGDDLPMEE